MCLLKVTVSATPLFLNFNLVTNLLGISKQDPAARRLKLLTSKLVTTLWTLLHDA